MRTPFKAGTIILSPYNNIGKVLEDKGWKTIGVLQEDGNVQRWNFFGDKEEQAVEIEDDGRVWPKPIYPDWYRIGQGPYFVPPRERAQ